jgi:2-polyprenyl-3-methyl-5-hydroxy-6-metoxy-1,4-benzoquinol methylase
MLVQILRKTPPLRWTLYHTGAARARDLVRRIERFIQPSDTVLDIGAGNCNICEILRGRGIRIEPMDVKNLSFVPSITPTLYDGSALPFSDGQFDVGLLITVLHHTPDPQKVVQEAARVCQRLVLIEDIFTSRPHKYMTFAADSLLNAEFFGHPHTNKSDAGWRELFDRLGLRLLAAEYQRSFLVFTHATYYLECGGAEMTRRRNQDAPTGLTA